MAQGDGGHDAHNRRVRLAALTFGRVHGDDDDGSKAGDTDDSRTPVSNDGGRQGDKPCPMYVMDGGQTLLPLR